MAKKPGEQITRAKELYQQGMKLVDIAAEIGRPEGTIRRWKSAYGWDENKANEKSERSHKKTNVREGKKTKEKMKLLEEIEIEDENAELNDRQRLFCLLYSKSFNATKSYQKAYECSYESAMVNGSRLLRNDKVRAEVLRLKENRIKRELISEEDIFQKYVDIAFADVTDFVEVKNGLARVKDSRELDGTVISDLKMSNMGAVLKLENRMKALEWLSKQVAPVQQEVASKLEDLL